MWTLFTQLTGKVILTGLFATEDAAATFGEVHLPKFETQPIELLTTRETEAAITAADAWTWDEQRGMQFSVGIAPDGPVH